MSVSKREVKSYLKSINKLLLCKRKYKRQFLKEFSSNIDEYLNEHPDATFDELQKDMGTVEEIANEFLLNESAEGIKKRIFLAKCIKCAVPVVILAFAITSGVTVKSKYNEVRYRFGGYDVEILFEIVSGANGEKTTIELDRKIIRYEW